MTTDQLKVLHTHRTRLERASDGAFARAEYDLILINVGHVRPDADGVISSKALTNPRFERVMALLEELLAKVEPRTGTYWRDRDRRRGDFLTSRQEWEIGRIHDQLRNDGLPYELSGLVRRQSGGRGENVHDLKPGEAAALIEMLKQAGDRHGKTKLDHGRTYIPVNR